MLMYSEIVKNRKQLLSYIKDFGKAEPKNKDVADTIVENLKEKLDHFVSFDETCKITYVKAIPAGAYYVDDKRTKNRISTTLGRYIRRQLLLDQNVIDDTLLSKLTDFVDIKIKTVVNKEKDITELKGLEVKKYYANPGAGCSSCMTGAANSDKVNIYWNNPEKVSLFIVKGNGNKAARGLVFTADNGTRVLGRVYGSEYRTIIAHCKANKILYSGDVGMSKLKNLRITLNYKTKYFPSTDVFPYALLDNPVMENRNKPGTVILSADSKFGNARLQMTNGNYFIINKCAKCDCAIDTYYGTYRVGKDTYCHACYKKEICVCDNCHIGVKKSEIIKLGPFDRSTDKNQIKINSKNIKNICKKCSEFKNKLYYFTCDLCKEKAMYIFINYINMFDHHKSICPKCTISIIEKFENKKAVEK